MNKEILTEEELFKKVLSFVIEKQTVSISTIRKKFSLDYSKAGDIIDQMDKKGYVTPFEGGKLRQVLISREKFEEIYGNTDER